jgi:hypothetical protein
MLTSAERSNRRRAKMKKTKMKKIAKNKVKARKKLAKKAGSKKASSRKKKVLKKKRVRGKSENVDRLVFEPQGLGARSAGQSGDLQGLSGIAGADSESVEELLEEGNAFEAEIVKGVQDAAVADETEVISHEVPEDDVPGEYLEEK